jgi:hypothetical protein
MRLGVASWSGALGLAGVLCAADVAGAEPDEADPGKAGAPAESESQSASQSADKTKPAEPPPRPPPLGAGEPGSPPPSRRQVDIGIDVAYVSRPASALEGGAASPVRFDPAIGYGFHGRIDILRYLRFTGYFVSSTHELTK